MKISKFLIFIISLILLSSCSEQRQKNTIIVGTSADNPPFEFIKDNKIIGMDIDIINEISKGLGKKVVIKNLDFTGLIAALTTKNVDLIISGISSTPDRIARADFSIPYATIHGAIMYRVNDSFKTKDDLKGKILGAQMGTTWSKTAKTIANELHNKVNTLSNLLMLIQELKNGSIDALVLEESVANKFISQNPDLASFALEGVSEGLSIAFPKDSELRDHVNKEIERLRIHGTLNAIEKKWLN